jgi:thioredoxin reductase (NADPH)
MFPTLTAEQIAHLATHGVMRPIARGQVSIEACDSAVPFFAVTLARHRSTIYAA